MNAVMNIPNYMDYLQTQGRYTFSIEEAIAALGASRSAVYQAVFRQQKASRVQRIYEGFYVIVPPEYRTRGIVPAEWFIDAMMEKAGARYYVGLLSAAAAYGASHQQPQAFSVVTDIPRRNVRLPNLHLHFLKRNAIDTGSVLQRKSQTGYYNISSPALTAMDLVFFMKQAGGLARVFEVLSELAVEIDAEEITHLAQTQPQFSCIQRLGWLLDRAGHPGKAEGLEKLIGMKAPRAVLLEPGSSHKSVEQKDSRWRVIVNTDIEGDE